MSSWGLHPLATCATFFTSSPSARRSSVQNFSSQDFLVISTALKRKSGSPLKALEACCNTEGSILIALDLLKKPRGGKQKTSLKGLRNSKVDFKKPEH